MKLHPRSVGIQEIIDRQMVEKVKMLYSNLGRL